MPGSLLAFLSFPKARASSLVLGHLWALHIGKLQGSLPEGEPTDSPASQWPRPSLNILHFCQTPRQGPVCLSPCSSQVWSLWVGES